MIADVVGTFWWTEGLLVAEKLRSRKRHRSSLILALIGVSWRARSQPVRQKRNSRKNALCSQCHREKRTSRRFVSHLIYLGLHPSLLCPPEAPRSGYAEGDSPVSIPGTQTVRLAPASPTGNPSSWPQLIPLPSVRFVAQADLQTGICPSEASRTASSGQL
jgi:hypothetical protein